MEFINILYQMHIQQTISKGCMFQYKTNFNKSKINYSLLALNNKELINKMIHDYHPDYKHFVERCWFVFKNTYPNLPIGSVHVNPEIWIQICLLNVIKFLDSNENEISIPNGCCNSENCSINLLYKTVLKILTI
jgi:hypothetical protein